MVTAHPFWDHIGSIYCINLLERDDRLQHAQKEFDNVGLLDRVHFHKVHKHPTAGYLGLFNAMLEIFQIEKNKHVGETILKPIAIFEDDLHFLNEKSHYLDELVEMLDAGITTSSYNSWDTVRLGHIKTCFVERMSNNIFRGNAISTHGVVYAPCFIDRLLQAQVVPNGLPDKQVHVDQYLSRVTGRNLIPWEQVVSQGNHGSDIVWKVREGDTDVERLQNAYLADPQGYIKSNWIYSTKMWKEVESMSVAERIKYYQENCKHSDISKYVLEDTTLV
jgi:GR25 family glycosyltransferase involved in LPS biosynthesis